MQAATDREFSFHGCQNALFETKELFSGSDQDMGAQQS